MKKFVRAAAVALSLCMSAGLFACGEKNVPGGGEEMMGEKVSVYEKDGLTGLTANALTIAFDQSGNMRVFGGEKELTSAEGAGNFTLYVDFSTSDPFDTRENFSELTKLSSSEAVYAGPAAEKTQDGMKLTNVFTFSPAGKTETIAVTQTIAVRDRTSEAEIGFTVKNDVPSSTVVALVAGQAGGLSEDFTLFWPLHEGYLVPSAVSAAKSGALSVGRADSAWRDVNVKNITYSYPAPLSMALTQVYNGSESLYLYAKDETNEIKRFNFGVFDGEWEYDAGKTGSCSLSMTAYPYVAGGTQKSTYPVVIGVAEGGWYDGSDSYRAYKLTQDIRSKHYTQKAIDCNAVFSDTACQANMQPKLCYDLRGSTGKNFTADLASQAEWVDEMHIDDMISIGWHANGFDTMYPDYDFHPSMGTEADFRSGVEKLHKNGDKLLPYLNAWAILSESEWYRSAGGAGDRAAVKKRSFTGDNYNIENYYTWGKFIGACPYSDEYVEAFTAAAERLAKNGADGLWLDQLMEMPAEFCYDKTHGHENPATAYGQGMEKLMTSVRKAFEKYSDDFYFVCEGLNDAYLKYVDIPGNMWSRALTFTENCAPEITRYTIPSRILGLWNRDDAITTPNEHAIACYLGDPLLMQGGSKNPYSRKYIELYERLPDVYAEGRFYADKGVTAPENIKISIKAGDGRFVVTAYNLSDADARFSLKLDLSAIGFAGREILRVSGATERQNVYAFSGTEINIEAGRNAITSYLVELK